MLSFSLPLLPVCFDGENKLTLYCYRKYFGSALKQNTGLHDADRAHLMTHVAPSHDLAVSAAHLLGCSTASDVRVPDR